MSQTSIKKIEKLIISDNVHELKTFIANLIQNNFEQLIWILYRFDVDEKELKQALAAESESAEQIIAQKLMMRVKQTRENKENSKSDDTSNWSFELD